MSYLIPDEWFCPISRELMTDPVIGRDGVTYDRKHIERWLTSNSGSPKTDLIPNTALKYTIAAFLSANPERIGQTITAPRSTSTTLRKHAS